MKFSAPRLQRVALACYLALIGLTLLWEGWLAPAPGAPPGFWLTIKSIPLLFPLFGILRGRRTSYLWASLLLLAYFTEGVVVAYTDRHAPLGLHAPWLYALMEIVLVLGFIASAAYYVRRTATDQ
jgi:uncharacterized membrane protein